jgi:hypothetical protein
VKGGAFALAMACALQGIASAAIDPVIGTTGVIGKGGDGAVCAETRDKLKAAYASNENHDTDGVKDALQGGTQFFRGERVLVIDNDTGSGVMEGIDVRVRILSGPDKHLACWAWEDTMHLQPAR